jgi:hypothetical protein
LCAISLRQAKVATKNIIFAINGKTSDKITFDYKTKDRDYLICENVISFRHLIKERFMVFVGHGLSMARKRMCFFRIHGITTTDLFATSN